MEDLNLPIAQRRTPRLSAGKFSSPRTTKNLEAQGPGRASIKTPSKPKSKKRVRFSDSPTSLHASSSLDTGLTPMVARTSLDKTPSPKRRRHSTPARWRYDRRDEDEQRGTQIRITPLRAVLDERVKRRIRRNGLSAEMNTIATEQRQMRAKSQVELDRLRRELAQRDAEIAHFNGTDTSGPRNVGRTQQLEAQVEELKSRLSSRSSADSDTHSGWNSTANDTYSGGFLDNMDDFDFGDTTMAELQCSTPVRAALDPGSSFMTPPSTSPLLPTTPTPAKRMPDTRLSLTCAGTQASLPDPEKEALEAELGSLRIELTKLTKTIESHEAFGTRMLERLSAAGSTTQDAANREVEANLDSVLRSLSERTAVLAHLNSSIGTLGFPGRDADEIIASLANSFRTARLELEYLTPGEIALPLTSNGAKVLDLVLSRLRDLARKVKINEDTIDEYHELELSLRQQLGARVDAMDSLQAALKQNEVLLTDKDNQIAELEIGLSRLKGAVDGYRRDISELEDLVQRMEAERNVYESRMETELNTARDEAAQKAGVVAELESRLGAALATASELQNKLADEQARFASESAAQNQAHGAALALRDARIVELRTEVGRLNAALHTARNSIQQLRVDNNGLKGSLSMERKRVRSSMNTMKAELERVVRMSEGLLNDEPDQLETPGEEIREEDLPSPPNEELPTADDLLQESARMSVEPATGSQKRRKYDSGLGMLDEDGFFL